MNLKSAMPMAFFNLRDHFFRGINPTVIISFMPMALLLRKPGNFFRRMNSTVIISFMLMALLLRKPGNEK